MRTMITFLICFCASMSFAQVQFGQPKLNDLKVDTTIVEAANRPVFYIPPLYGKKVGVVANHTSVMDEGHLVDFLLSQDVQVQSVFAPEHGFRGDAANGEKVVSGKDEKTGLTIHSLYGKTKKPTPEMLRGIEVMVFDMQDVGARFYTYLSTLFYVMEAAAENGIKVMVLDRPNPNGFYVDGPVLDPALKSFVGIIPIPIVHGMTLGELAQMINGEGWLKGGVQCDLKVIKCKNYEHRDLYNLPVAPSPNLQSMEAVYLYPSLCLFEPTIVSVGRGTDYPFEIYGYPGHKYGSFSFTPKSMPGKSLHPKYEGERCNGQSLKEFGSFYFQANKRLYLGWLTGMMETADEKDDFFTSGKFFDKLAGTTELRKQLKAGVSENEIRESWDPALSEFKEKRKKYLLYME